jgi:hypothetical protein
MNTSQGTSADWLLGAFKKNPEGFLLLAAGAVLLMRQGRNSQPQAVASDAASSVADAAAGARDYAADVTNRTARSASSMASAASEYATQATRKVGEQSERVVQQAQSTLQQGINRVLKEQPLVIAVAGIAAGAAIASAFPATDFEKETLGPIGDQVADAANRVGEQLKEATATAGETLKKAADERGLNAEGLKEVASEVAGAFKGSIAGDEQTNKPKDANRGTGTEYAGHSQAVRTRG